ncbi:toll/interleukin-1 receptor domain-containing protein [Oculatella sp. LEGE 06141]|uniref:toll/interleukin-1 receptor domain-containing protein n=1 Tax=Oculatella sp. LEGE 06141 TaxID=1828648 RepID=UPI001D14DDBE|nr:toll/interleukin-1 receptor domain-containing protein [Oculatella sp. LEGE 06141]
MADVNHVKVTVAFTDPDIDAEERDEEAQWLFNQLCELEDVESVDRVLDPHPPEGNKAFGGFLAGMVSAEVKPANARSLFGFLGDRPVRSSFEMEIEANGRKMKVKASSPEEVQAAMLLMQQFMTVDSTVVEPIPQMPLIPIAAEPTPPIQAIEVFFSYSHKDEELRDELATHLSMLKRQGIISAWHDREISAGQEWAAEIFANLNSAHIILLLVSANFLASDYCYDKEMLRAMERHEARDARVIPIILKPCDWADAPFGKLQALPKNALPITKWGDRDDAFLNVAQGIRTAIQQMVNRC